jgi:hypothetical protein
MYNISSRIWVGSRTRLGNKLDQKIREKKKATRMTLYLLTITHAAAKGAELIVKVFDNLDDLNYFLNGIINTLCLPKIEVKEIKS